MILISSMPHTLPSISMTIPELDSRATSPLPPIGHDISRSPSTSTAHSDRRGSPIKEQVTEKVTLPSLSSLTKVAVENSAAQGFPVAAAAVHHAHTYSNASPTPTSVAGQGNVPPVCQNCQTSTTPLWRRDEAGSVLCNACGLFLKLHGRPRPISLKTDVIKSRNRVKSTAQNGRRKMQFSTHQSLPPHGELSTPPHPSYRRVSDQHISAFSDRSASPISRAGTPSSLHPHHTYPGHHHTAPPLTHQLFDPSMARSPSPMPPHGAHYHHSHSAPSTIAHRGASPNPHAPTLPLPVPTVGGLSHSPPTHHHAPPSASTAELQTRISELEVINALYKGQLQEMENHRKRDADTIDYLRREIDELRRAALQARQLPTAMDATPPQQLLPLPQQQHSPPPSTQHHQQQQQQQQEQHQQHIPPPPPPPTDPNTEAVDYATMTGSVKRRRGRTLERAGEDTRQYGNKRRETGEFPRPELAAVRV